MDNNGTIYKGAHIQKGAATDDVMAKINQYTLTELSADDVFIFKVAMCDNAIDRHWEAFTKDALAKMGELFVGKTIIKDHRASADNQVGRIFATEVVEDSSKQGHDGGAYAQLVAHCYMLKTESNADLIAEVNAGIKKEVSVGFRVASAVCSICGMDNAKTACSHWWGKEYDGRLCYFQLADVSDAYELSFVAVPAQREAGTVKGYNPNLKKEEDPEDEEPKPEDEETPPEEEPKPEDGEEDEPEEEKNLQKRMRALDAFIFIESKKEE